MPIASPPTSRPRWKIILRDAARESPARIAPGPAADLLCRHLPHLPPGNKAWGYGIDILIQGNCLAQAAQVLDAAAGNGEPCSRLKKAHVAMRRRDYRELGRLLAGMAPPATEFRDEWLYLNSILHEKLAEKSKAAAFAKKIKSPYYRNLSLVQQSDRGIYKREFSRVRAQLSGALDFFTAGRRCREVIEAQSQMAKLLREEGDFASSESLYKTIFVQGEAEGLALSSAGAAVDLGNLYAENDDDFQAECWYQKAGRLYAGEKDSDGLMLVNANLVNVLLAKGDWLQADALLRNLLAWDEEKKLLDSCAIDLLNWAGLETLRLHDEKALKLIDRAETIFRGSSNSKGLGECAFLRGRLSGFAEKLSPAPPGDARWFSDDQKAVCDLFRLFTGGGDDREAEMTRRLQAIGSRKLRFEALRLLLIQFRRHEWLGRFKDLAWELSPRAKNYFYFEYWHMHFDLAPEGPPADRRDEFLAMYDFFTVNKRSLPARLTRLRQQCEESEKGLGLFADAHLVEQYRSWRLPVDFFNSFFREIARSAPIDWLVMAVHEKQQPLFRFASSDQFRDLGEEMLRDALATPLNQNHGLAEVRGKYRSPERLFYPFANTKLLHWPIAEDILACLVIGSRDDAMYFQDLRERHRETFKKFSLLFRNFLQNEYRIDEKLDFIVGTSEKIREMKRLIAQVSKVDFSLLISGESGSGKELVARAVHLLSPRAGQPFISVNAAAIPDTLLEAELFGFKKGAFSGAAENRVGLLEAADRGTLFLDEIADLPLALQAKLLRALQEREIRRLGENKTIRIDVRLVSASNRDLGELIRRELFREDLFYRLQDLVIRIPPLRERREDIPLLIDHFLKKFGYPGQEPARLDAMADLFRNDKFPGNVRELESRIKNMITFNPELELPPRGEQEPFSWKSARQEHEKDLLLKTLKELNWQQEPDRGKTGYQPHGPLQPAEKIPDRPMTMRLLKKAGRFLALFLGGGQPDLLPRARGPRRPAAGDPGPEPGHAGCPAPEALAAVGPAAGRSIRRLYSPPGRPGPRRIPDRPQARHGHHAPLPAEHAAAGRGRHDAHGAVLPAAGIPFRLQGKPVLGSAGPGVLRGRAGGPRLSHRPPAGPVLRPGVGPIPGFRQRRRRISCPARRDAVHPARRLPHAHGADGAPAGVATSICAPGQSQGPFTCPGVQAPHPEERPGPHCHPGRHAGGRTAQRGHRRRERFFLARHRHPAGHAPSASATSP